jgi:hypothetical protein
MVWLQKRGFLQKELSEKGRIYIVCKPAVYNSTGGYSFCGFSAMSTFNTFARYVQVQFVPLGILFLFKASTI